MIGVDNQALTLGTSPSCYKRDILFYDGMLLMHSDVAITEWRHGDYSKAKYREYADEMEFLLETPYFAPADRLAGVPISGPAVGELREALFEIDRRLQQALPQGSQLTIPVGEFSRLQGLHASLTTRLAAASLTSLGTEAVSAHKMPAFAAGQAIPSLGAGDVIRLAIGRVLIPDDQTSWEDIFALKQDRDLQDRARKLRLWAAKTAKSETSLGAIDEQLADLLSDYEHYLRAHRLKYRSITLGTVITESAELFEDLLKARLGKIAGRFFTASKTKAEMAFSEMKAPGRELSIVTQLNDRLK